MILVFTVCGGLVSCVGIWCCASFNLISRLHLTDGRNEEKL